MKRCTLLLAITAAIVGAAHVGAQPLYHETESLEYTVANADVVVIGTLLELRDEKLPEDRFIRRAKMAVEKTLKGDHSEFQYVRLSKHNAKFSVWQDQSSRLLLAIKHDTSPALVIDLSSDKLEVMRADFSILRKSEGVLRVVDETMQRMPGVRRTFKARFLVPHDVIVKTRWDDGAAGLFLIVAADERLEKRAQALIRSDDYPRRIEGVQALRFFKSDENIALMKTLLDDPGFGYHRAPTYSMGMGLLYYAVRNEAYEALKKWGLDVEEPVIREEKYLPNAVTVVDLAGKPVVAGQLEKLARFENLRMLYINETAVTDESLSELVHLKKLSDLFLEDTSISDAGLNQLAKLKKLQFVDLTKTQVTEAGIAELRKLRPDLKIEH